MTDLSRLSKLHIREIKVCLYKEADIVNLTGNILVTESYPSCALLFNEKVFQRKNSAHCIIELQKFCCCC